MMMMMIMMMMMMISLFNHSVIFIKILIMVFQKAAITNLKIQEGLLSTMV